MSGTNTLPTMSRLIKAKMDPHLAAMADIFRRELENFREAEINREDVILRLQQSVLNNTKAIIDVMALYVEFGDDVSQTLALAAALEARNASYEQKITELEERLNQLERR